MLTFSHRVLLLTIAGLALAASSRIAGAQVRLGPEGPFVEEQPGAPPRPQPGGPFATYTVTMPSEPLPSLAADALWPRIGQLTPGNSVPYWYRAIGSLERAGQSQPDLFRQAFGGGKTTAWIDLPIAALPRDEVRQFLDQFAGTFEDAHIAASREQTDWSLRVRDLQGLAAIEFRLTEFQDARSLTRLIKLRMHLALADGDFRAAADWARVGFRLSRALDSDECIILDLIGVASSTVVQAELAEMMSLSASPNLYWALSGVPEPLVNCRDAIDTELTLPERVFPWFGPAEAQPRSSAAWRNDFRRTVRDSAKLTSDSQRDPAADAADWLADVYLLQSILNGYPGALRDVKADGTAPAAAEAMSVGQVVAVHQFRTLRRLSDESLKGVRRADPALIDVADRALRRFLDMPYSCVDGPSRATFSIGELVPGVTQLLKAESRQVVRHRALLVVEALRLHAAEHHGQLPKSLDEITVVPVPRHPVTGKHFPYAVTEDHAVLDAPTGFPGETFVLMRFELKPGRK